MQVDRFPEGTISKIEFEGNATIPPEKIKPKLLSRVGQPLDQDKVEADLKSLLGTKWFSDVEVLLRRDTSQEREVHLDLPRPGDALAHQGRVRGRKAIRQKEIEETTGLKVGNRADPTRTRLALGQIQRLYQEKGTTWPRSSCSRGATPATLNVVIEIFEGPKVKIGSINFMGNTFATDAPRLRTMIGTRKPILGLFGKYHRDMLDEDRQKLIEYYQQQGFFEVKVTPVTRPGNDPGEVDLTFVIAEGTQYRVRNLIIEGNYQDQDGSASRGNGAALGQAVPDRSRDADRNRMLAKYNEIGCIDTEIVIEPRFTNQHGVVDLVYKIEEGEPYLLGELKIQWATRGPRTR